MTKPGPSVTSGADTQPGSDSLFPSGFGGGAAIRTGGVGTAEIADGSVAAADLNLASVAGAIAARSELTSTYAQRSAVDVTEAVFGAVGDGSTDDTAAIRAAITAGAGGIVTFPARTYKVQTTAATPVVFDIPANTRLAFLPGATLSFTSDVVGSVRTLFRNAGANVTIDGGTFNRSGSDFWCQFIDVKAYDNFTIRNAVFNGNSVAYGGTSRCNWMLIGGYDGTHSGLTVLDTTVTQFNYGLLMNNSSLAVISRTTFERCIFSQQYKTDLELNAPNGTLTGTRITSCSFSGNLSTSAFWGWGVGFAHCTDAIVRGCTFTGTAYEAVHIEDTSTRIRIIDNDFYSCALSAGTYIKCFDSCRQIVIEGNSIDGSAQTVHSSAIQMNKGAGSSTMTASTTLTVGAGRTLTFSGVNIPFSLPVGGRIFGQAGAVFTLTQAKLANDTTVTGDLTVAGIASGDALTAFVTPGGRDTISTANTPSQVRIANNDINCGSWNDGISLSGVSKYVVTGNTIFGTGAVSGGNFTGTSTSIAGLYASAGTGGTNVNVGNNNVISNNSFSGLRYGVSSFANANAFGQGAVVTGNTFTDCLVGLDARNNSACTLTGNEMFNCIYPVLTGIGTVGNSTAPYPFVASDNHAYGCNKPMLIDGSYTVTASGAVTIGSGVTLTVSGLIGLLLYIPSGTVFTFSGGGVFTTTAASNANTSTLTGNLTGANIANGETSTVYLAHSTVSAQDRRRLHGNADSLGSGYVDSAQLGARFRSGLWYGAQGSTATAALTAGSLGATPFYVPRTITLTSIGVNVTVAGAAATVVRLGIYSDVSDAVGGYPGALLLEAGTVAGDAVAFASLAINLVLPPGLYWLAAVAQGGTPTLTVVNGPGQVVGHNAASSLSSRSGYRQTSVTGSLPATFTTTVDAQGSMPQVQVKVG